MKTYYPTTQIADDGSRYAAMTKPQGRCVIRRDLIAKGFRVPAGEKYIATYEYLEYCYDENDTIFIKVNDEWLEGVSTDYDFEQDTIADLIEAGKCVINAMCFGDMGSIKDSSYILLHGDGEEVAKIKTALKNARGGINLTSYKEVQCS